MIAMAGLLLTLSIAGNVFQLYLHAKKPKPRKQLPPAPEPKGLLEEKHTLVRLYIGTNPKDPEGSRIWFFKCSCGISYSKAECTSEQLGLELWKSHVAIYREFTPEGAMDEKLKLEKEFEEFKRICVCQHGQYLGL